MSALARRWKQWQLGGGWVGNRGTKARRSTHSHRSTHPHLRTNSKAQTPRLQQKPWLLVRLFRKASSIPCRVFFCSVLCCILIAPRAVCGCSTSSLLSREDCTAWQDVCVQLCIGTAVVLPAYVYVAATLLFYVLCDNGIGRTVVCVIHLRQCKHGT